VLYTTQGIFIPAIAFRRRTFHAGCRTAIALRDAGFDARYMTAGSDEGHKMIEPSPRFGELTDSGQYLLPGGYREMLHTTTAGTSAPKERRSKATLDDVALINRVASKDGAAFETLYRGYYPRLQRFLERVTRRPQIVEEILNDTMLVVWRKASSYNLHSQVSTWIFGIAFRRALKALKRFDAPVDFDSDEIPAQGSAGPEGMLLQHETRARIAQALKALSADHRAVIELTYFEGYSCAEIAEIMRCPVGTVKTRMFHARRRLRMLLADDAGDGA
jgi:RNA polymerase sigma factor (sigma-70 family)